VSVPVKIPMVDLTLVDEDAALMLDRIRAVMERGVYLLGPETRAFEEALCAEQGTRRAIAVGSGTDALILGLRGLGIAAGDEVVVPAMTAFPTAAAVVEACGTPVIVDIERDRPLLSLEQTIAALSPRTRAVILVHLYGLPADAAEFRRELDARGVALIEDCAQAQGAKHTNGRPVGALGAFGALSFYPTKNLAALGDGGAVVTDDDHLADEVAAWRSHGERRVRYEHELPARNSRLDELQAAVLRSRLELMAAQVERRRELSRIYADRIVPELGYVAHGEFGAPHLAVVRAQRRDELSAFLRSEGIGTGVHYPKALTSQNGLRNYAVATASPNADRWARECLSIPLHPRMGDADAAVVAQAINSWAAVSL
jgi:dTDP-3-amino-3,4,6-trideoxy-alpha-D-glucose transaminase